jgi:heat shock protein HspQ
LKREVGDRLYKLIELILSQHEEKISKENAIQFWFDIRFLFEIFSGRTITNPQMKHIFNELNQQKQSLELQNHIQDTKNSTPSINENESVGDGDKTNCKRNETANVIISDQNNRKERKDEFDIEDEEVDEMIEWKKKIDSLLNKLKEKVH